MTRPLALSLACALAAFGLSAASEPAPALSEVAEAWGLPPGNAHRNRLVDIDGDGWTDAVVDNQRLHRNVPAPDGSRRFEEVAGWLADPATGAALRPDVLVFADLDGDGDQDAYVGFSLDPSKPGWQDPGRRSGVWRNEGGWRLVPAPSPGLDVPEAVIAAAWLDFDRDGLLDLVTACSYREGGAPLEAYPLRLWRGRPGLGFEDVTAQAGLALVPEPGRPDSRRPLYGLTTADLDGDGWPEVLGCAYGRQWNLLFWNQRDGTFRDVGREGGFAGDEDASGLYPEDTKRWWKERFGHEREDERPFRSNGNTFDAAVVDVDGDGDEDVFLAEITHAWAGPSSDRSALLENLGGSPPRFRRHPDAAPRVHQVPGWNQGDLYAGWLDADQDGRPDLLLASGDYPDEQRLRLFRNLGGLRLEDATRAWGVDLVNAAQPSLADLDRDGSVDLLCGNTNVRLDAKQREGRVLRPHLWLGRRTPGHHTLHVRLEGTGPLPGGRGSNRDAIGARVEVVASGSDGPLRLVRQVQGGRGHCGHDDAREVVVGLGPRARVDRLVVTWPDRAGTTSVWTDLPADRVLRVRQTPDGARLDDLGPH